MSTVDKQNSTFSVTFEPTPNPAVYKFNVNATITQTAYECSSVQDAERSPLANKIFGFPWASGVFIGQNFVTVTKQEWVDWEILAEPLAGLIKEHLNDGLPVLLDLSAEAQEENALDSAEVKAIKKILNAEIRPQVALDGGDVAFVKFDEGTLYLQMKGACSGCPSSSATLKFGIEARLKESIPTIKEVVAI